MKKYGRIDANQDRIRKALRQAGCSVVSTASIGDGFVDLVVGRGGINYLLEVKDGSQPLSKRKLTKDELAFHNTWKGWANVVYDVDTAMKAVGLI